MGHLEQRLGAQGTPLDLSEQFLVDCDSKGTNHGCMGGLPGDAFTFLTGRGIASTESYPYKARDMKCKAETEYKKVATVSGDICDLTRDLKGEAVGLRSALVNHISVSSGYEVTRDFSGYKDGVYTNPKCGTSHTDVNHAVLTVGYGVDETTGLKFWKVKNSWGGAWGKDGFFKIQADVNMCGWNNCNAYPEVVKAL